MHPYIEVRDRYNEGRGLLSNSRIRRRSALAALGALFFASCTKRQAKDRRLAPEFSLKDADGKTVRLSDYRGKVVLLDFWATWCGPCKLEIPWFMEFERKYKDRGFAVLGVSMDDDGWPAIKPFLQELGVNYRVVLGNEKTGDAYGGIEALPTAFLIDRDGRVAFEHVGVSSRRMFENDIEKLLEAPAGDKRAALQ